MPTHNHPLHAFDLRSVVLFTCLTMGGTSAVMAQSERTSPAPSITPSESFMRADADRNGMLSRQEAQQLPAVAEQFDAWDGDGNSQLSLPEFLLHVNKAPKP